MTGRERVEALLSGKPADRPPFGPAVYEHKAALVGATPSRLARDPGLIERAMAREVEIYDADLLVVGCDVYNVEAEALGAAVRFSEANDVPAIVTRPLRPGDALESLRHPDPNRDGRMPVFLEAGRRVAGRFGRERVIRGALSAPFSIAAELVGAQDLLPALIDNPGWVAALLSRTAEVVMAYGRAFVERGLGLVLFDSHATPPLLSPRLYRDIVLPPTRDVVRYFREDLGVPLVPVIMGGDTAVVLEDLLATGTNNILCDFKADLAAFISRLGDRPVLLRANLDPGFLQNAPFAAVEERTRQILALGRRYPRFIFGTGILPYDLPPERVQLVRRVLEER